MGKKNNKIVKGLYFLRHGTPKGWSKHGGDGRK